jgi:hypothetical protein
MTVVSIDQTNGTGRHIVSEARGYRSREQVVIAMGGIRARGLVLGRITATGQYAPYTPGAADGSETAAAVLFEEVDATAAPVKATVHVRDTEFMRAELAFAGTPTQGQKDAAYASLASAGCAFR